MPQQTQTVPEPQLHPKPPHQLLDLQVSVPQSGSQQK
jgi:hypothetical protein